MAAMSLSWLFSTTLLLVAASTLRQISFNVRSIYPLRGHSTFNTAPLN